MKYLINIFSNNMWTKVLETSDYNEMLEKKKELEESGEIVLVDYDN